MTIDKKIKYKSEQWNIVKWKGTKREIVKKETVLVKRFPKNTIIDGKNVSGRFVKTIKNIEQKTYGTGVYHVGKIKTSSGRWKIVTRRKIAEKTPLWYENRKEVLKNRILYRTAYVLSDVPYRGNEYYGFRIIAFHWNKKLLERLKQKLKDRLKRFIEDCLGYKEDEFWFDMYFGYSPPEPSNGYKSDIGKYYLIWEKAKGGIKKQEVHEIIGLK